MSFLVSKEDFQEFLQDHYRTDADTAQNLSDFVDSNEDTLQRNDGFIDLEKAAHLIGKAAQGYVSQFNPENALPFTTAYNAYLEKKQGANPAKVANLVPNQDAPREYSGSEKIAGNPESLQAAAVVANGENPVANFSHQNLLQGLQNDFASACDYLNQPFPKSMELLAFVFTEHNLGDSYGSTTPALRDSLIALGQEPQAALVMAEKLNTVFLGLTKNNPAFLPIRLALMTKPHGQSFDDFLNSTNENGIDYRTLMYRAVQDLITNSDTGFANAVYEFAPQIEDGKKAQLKRISQVLGQWGDMNPAESAAALVCVALENPEQTKEIENRLGYSLDKFTAAMQHCERVMDPQKGRVSAGYFGPSPLFFELTDEQNQFIIATALAIKEAEFFEGAKQNLIMVSAILLPMLAAKVFAAAVLVKVAAGGVVGLAVQAAQEGDAHIERENEFTQTQAYQAAGAFGEKEIFGVTAEDVIADDKYNTAADNAALARIAFGAASGVFVAPGKGVQLLVTDTFSGAVMATGDAVVGQHVFTENGLEEENAMALSDAFLMGAFVGGALNLGTSLGGSTVKGVKGLFGGTPKTPTPRTAQAPGLKYRSLGDGPKDFTKPIAGEAPDTTFNKKNIEGKANKETADNKLDKDTNTFNAIPTVVAPATRNLADAEEAGLVTEPLGQVEDLSAYQFRGEHNEATPPVQTDSNKATDPLRTDPDIEDMALAVGGDGQRLIVDATTDADTNSNNVLTFPGADTPRNATGGGDSGDGGNAPGQGKPRWGTGRPGRIEPGRGRRRPLSQPHQSTTPHPDAYMQNLAQGTPIVNQDRIDPQQIRFAPEDHQNTPWTTPINQGGDPENVYLCTTPHYVTHKGEVFRVVGTTGENQRDILLIDENHGFVFVEKADYRKMTKYKPTSTTAEPAFDPEQGGQFQISDGPDGQRELRQRPIRKFNDSVVPEAERGLLGRGGAMPAANPASTNPATAPTLVLPAAQPSSKQGGQTQHHEQALSLAASPLPDPKPGLASRPRTPQPTPPLEQTPTSPSAEPSRPVWPEDTGEFASATRQQPRTPSNNEDGPYHPPVEPAAPRPNSRTRPAAPTQPSSSTQDRTALLRGKTPKTAAETWGDDFQTINQAFLAQVEFSGSNHLYRIGGSGLPCTVKGKPYLTVQIQKGDPIPEGSLLNERIQPAQTSNLDFGRGFTYIRVPLTPDTTIYD